MKTRLFLLSFVAVFAVACNQKAVDASTTSISNSDSVSTNESQAAPSDAQAESDIALPAPKAEDLQAKIKQQWEDAIASEKALLGTPKLIGWMDGLKSTVDEDGFDQPGKLTDKQFKSLSTNEQFCYYLFHPEMSSQNCSMAFFEAGLVQGISGSLPYGSEEYPSDRQMDAMNAKVAEVTALAKKCIQSNKSLSVQLMQAIVAFKMKELTLPLIDLYNAQPLKDDLILSTLIEMMRNAEFAAWQNSDVAAEMQKELGGEMGGERRDYAPLNDENVAKVIAIAKQFAAA